MGRKRQKSRGGGNLPAGRSERSLGSTSSPSPQMINLFGGAGTNAGVAVSHDTAMRVSAVYACVRVIAEDIAKLPVALWRRTQDGGQVAVPDHPLHRILQRPNPHMTIKSMMMAMASALGFRGNGIAVILRDARGREIGLWPVHPGSVTLYESSEGMIFYAITRRTTLDFAVLKDLPIMIPAYDVLHVKGLTFDGIVGLSPLAQLREAIGISIAGEQMSASLMANGAQPSGALKHPGELSDDVAARLRQQWSSRYGGSGNAGKTLVLEDGMSFEQIGMTSVDAQFLDQRKLTIEEIARGFRVPLHMIGMLDRMTNNNVEALNRGYYDQALMPLLEVFESEMSRAFNLPDDLFVEFDVKRLLRADFKARQEGNRTMWQSGAMSSNEWRIEEGMNPTKGGDVFARPLNTAYVDPDGKVVSVTPPGGAKTDGSGDPPGAAPAGGAEGDGQPTGETKP